MRIASYSLKFFVHYSMPITLGLLSQADFRTTRDRQNLSSQTQSADPSAISTDSSTPVKLESSQITGELPPADTNASTATGSALPPEANPGSDSNPETDASKPAETPVEQASAVSAAEKPAESTDQSTQTSTNTSLPETTATAAVVATTSPDPATSISSTTSDLAPMTAASESATPTDSSPKSTESDSASKQSEPIGSSTVTGNSSSPESVVSNSVTSTDSQVTKAEPLPESPKLPDPGTSASESPSTSVAESVKPEENLPKSAQAVAAAAAALAISAEPMPVKPDNSTLPVGYESAQENTPKEVVPSVSSSAESKVESPSGLTNTVVEKAAPIPESSGVNPVTPEAPSVTAQEPLKQGGQEVQSTTVQSTETSTVTAMNSTGSTPNVAMPAGFALAAEGETWQDVSRRVIGDDRWADLLWKENRDLHDGQFESRPLVGRLIRVPKLKPTDGVHSPASQVAIKSN